MSVPRTEKIRLQAFSFTALPLLSNFCYNNFLSQAS